MRTGVMALGLVAACGSPAAVVFSGPGEPQELSAEQDAPIVDPPTWSVAIEPAAPRWDEDLRCVVTGLSLTDDVTFAWTANGVPREARLTTERPWDTVGHRQQAGGQEWVCEGRMGDGSWRRSEPVRVEPPLAMALVAPGTYWHGGREHWSEVTLTRAYLIGRLEVTQDDWLRFGFALNPLLLEDSRTPVGPSQPLTYMTHNEARLFLNHLSVMDGLSECYSSCAGTGSDSICERPAGLYDCEGYRLPSEVEWQFAARERGRHRDDLPAGGNCECLDDPEDYEAGVRVDYPAVGPFAIPGTTVGSQGWYLRTAGGHLNQPVGQLIPNLLGLYDMVGNVWEYVEHCSVVSGGVYIDPIKTTGVGSMVVVGTGMEGPPIVNDAMSIMHPRSEWRFGFRASRTNTPIRP